MEKDWYAVLGVSLGAAPAEIKAAYRALALKHHPDRNPDDPQAAERLALINAAYEVLGDPEQRKFYDRDRRGAQDGNPQETAASKPAWRPPPEPKVAGSARGWTGRQTAARLVIAAGAAMAARGFLAVYGGPRSELLARWLYPRGGQDGAFLLYLGGMIVVFLGAGMLLRGER